MPMHLQADRIVCDLAGESDRLGRRLQLNYPLNYLVVPYLRLRERGLPVLDLLSKYWGHRLGAEGSQKHALNGAYALDLVNAQGETTEIGLAVAQLMVGIGFDVTSAPDRHERLADASPPLAAIARLLLMRLPTVQLVQQALQICPDKACFVPDLLDRAHMLNRVVANYLFISSVPIGDCVSGANFVNSTVFQFKQVLWHAGILRTKAHWSAGKRADVYLPYEDLWGLEYTAMDEHTTPFPKG